MSLADRIEEHWVALDLAVDDQAALFTWVAERMAASGFISDPVAAADKLLEREKIVSTAICPGVAVPHARCNDARGVGLCVVRLAQGMDFGARDGEPVRLVFALLGPPEATAEHVKVLGEIARLIRDRARLGALMKAASPEELVEVLRTASA